MMVDLKVSVEAGFKIVYKIVTNLVVSHIVVLK